MSIDPNKLRQAKEWARDNLDKGHFLHGDRVMAAAEVIAALPDEWIDAEKVRALLDRWAANPFPTSDEVAVLNDVEALLAPTPRTLADMTPAERETCKWMQVDTPEGEGVLLGRHDNAVMVVYLNGATVFWALSEVTPLPSLPRLEWPASEPGMDAPATIEDGDSVVVPRDTLQRVTTIMRHQGRNILTQELQGYLDDPQSPPSHPSELFTVEDYRNVPDGTVIYGSTPNWNIDSAIELRSGRWEETGVDARIRHSDLSGYGPHIVLKWGDGGLS